MTLLRAGHTTAAFALFGQVSALFGALRMKPIVIGRGQWEVFPKGSHFALLNGSLCHGPFHDWSDLFSGRFSVAETHPDWKRAMEELLEVSHATPCFQSCFHLWEGLMVLFHDRSFHD